MIKPIPNYPGYFADTKGNIWSARTRGPGNKNRMSSELKKLKPSRDSYDYFVVTLYGDKKHVRNIHQLILETFVGPRPEGLETCHNDGNPLNNKLDNLRWDTRLSNRKDMIKHGGSTRGERHPNVKLTELEVMEIKKLLEKEQMTHNQIGKMFGVHRNTITTINTGKRWGHI